MDMPWLRCHNPKIDWKTEEVKMTRYPEECGKKWKAGKQTKLGWKKQEERKGIKRGDNEDWVEAGGRKRSGDRGIVR